MGHEMGRPAPAAITHDTSLGAVPVDPHGAGLAAELDREEALACPSCGADLLGVEAFETARVCPNCERHFPLPALERLHLLVDADTFIETNGILVSLEPLIFRDLLPFPDRLAPIQERLGPGAGLGEAVITGTGEIGGRPAVLIVLDHTYLGGNIGPVAAEKVVLAMELATTRRLPLIALCAASYPGFPSGDESRMQAGMLSLAQWPKIAAAAARLRSAAVPVVSVLAHPTTGGVYAGLGGQADVMLAEPGAQIGLEAGSRGYPRSGLTAAEELLRLGQIDAVVDRRHLRSTVATLLGLFADRGGFVPPPSGVPTPVANQPPFWEQVALATHPDRPTGRDLVPLLTSEFVALHGDRIGTGDTGMTCGLGRMGGMPVALVAQNRHHPAGEQPAARAAAIRHVLRVLRLAGHLELPVVMLVDSPSNPTRAADDTGLGLALAELLYCSSALPVPIVSVLVGRGRGLAAMALGAGDRRLMLQHAVMIAGDEADPRLDQPPDRIALHPSRVLMAAQPLTAQECERLGLADTVVAEPDPAAHADPEATARLLKHALSRALAELTGMNQRRLLEDRARRVRYLGESTPEGREAARRELRELHELQRTLSRSLGDLRGRWGSRPRSLPRLPRPALPSVSGLPRPSQLDPSRFSTLVRPELADLAGRIAEGVRSRGHLGRDTPGPASEEAPPSDRPDPGM